MKLLSREEFRQQVFERDNNMCVICQKPAKDAHHIIERRLWDDGGYYVDNGVSLCSDCHIKAEETKLSCETLREAAGITKVLKPKQFYKDDQVDKWGNYVLPNGTRLRGELFYDGSVQKILKDSLYLFTDKVKYPRTPHLPWSPGRSHDELVFDIRNFENQFIVFTEKMDGENTTMYRDYIHARSLDSGHHPSRSWVKQLHASIAHDIPEGWRICGENLYAKHSIHYDNLNSYFMVFSIWNERNECLSWGDTFDWCRLLGLETVPFLFKMRYYPDTTFPVFAGVGEGYAVRKEFAFPYSEFQKSVAKYVRADHVQTNHNWMRQQVIPNKLRGERDD